MVRLDKYLSDCGLGTRKEVKKLIREGIVKVNGEVIVTSSFVFDETSEVSVEDEIIPYQKYVSYTTDFKSEEDYEKNDNLEFIGILPKSNVSEYINNLTKEELESLEKNAKEVDDVFEINLALPTFGYDYELPNFEQVLKDMGISLIFDAEKADFTNIIKTTHIYVNEAIHKTHIDLNEKGPKAAAVTFFGFKANGMLIQKKSVDITFDKPFIYMIRDKNSKELLFFGVVYEPNKWIGSTCNSEE